MNRPPAGASLFAGLAGAVALTVAHESIRRVWPAAPRLDTLGRRALARSIRAAGSTPPDAATQQAIALVGDVATNAALFGLAVAAGPPRSAPARGLAVGTVAGLATLVLPPILGIGPPPGRLPVATRVATMVLYAGGGLVSGLVRRRRVGRAAGSNPS